MKSNLKRIFFISSIIIVLIYFFDRDFLFFKYLTDENFIGIILMLSAIQVVLDYFFGDDIYLGPTAKISKDEILARKFSLIVSVFLFFQGLYLLF